MTLLRDMSSRGLGEGTMCHDDATNQARASTPAGLLRIYKVPSLIQELSVERSGEIVTQVVARPSLNAAMQHM